MLLVDNSHESKSSHISKVRSWKPVRECVLVHNVFAGVQPLHPASDQLDVLIQLSQNDHENARLFDDIESDAVK